MEDIIERYAAAVDNWRWRNEAIGELSREAGDPSRLQALLDSRAHLWHEFAAIVDAEGEAGR